MAFKYSCFISYRRIDVELANVFVDSLERALRNYITPYAPNTRVFLDRNEMKGAALFDPTLAQRICESVIMVMVYVPAYFDEEHRWCAREYQAMVELEAVRLAKLPGSARARQHGLIVPVVFRGASALPAEIKARRLYADFSKYSLAGKTDISRHRQYAQKIQDIADSFYEIWRDFQALSEDPCSMCNNFDLPDEAAVLSIIQRLQGGAPSAPVKHEAPPNG
jgi:hypothetical protein